MKKLKENRYDALVINRMCMIQSSQGQPYPHHRVRHWSSPDANTYQSQPAQYEEENEPPWECEDIHLLCPPHGGEASSASGLLHYCRIGGGSFQPPTTVPLAARPRLARWQDKVIAWRLNRSDRRRQKLELVARTAARQQPSWRCVSPQPSESVCGRDTLSQLPMTTTAAIADVDNLEDDVFIEPAGKESMMAVRNKYYYTNNIRRGRDSAEQCCLVELTDNCPVEGVAAIDNDQQSSVAVDDHSQPTTCAGYQTEAATGKTDVTDNFNNTRDCINHSEYNATARLTDDDDPTTTTEPANHQRQQAESSRLPDGTGSLVRTGNGPQATAGGVTKPRQTMAPSKAAAGGDLSFTACRVAPQTSPHDRPSAIDHNGIRSYCYAIRPLSEPMAFFTNALQSPGANSQLESLNAWLSCPDVHRCKAGQLVVESRHHHQQQIHKNPVQVGSFSPTANTQPIASHGESLAMPCFPATKQPTNNGTSPKAPVRNVNIDQRHDATTAHNYSSTCHISGATRRPLTCAEAAPTQCRSIVPTQELDMKCHLRGDGQPAAERPGPRPPVVGRNSSVSQFPSADKWKLRLGRREVFLGCRRWLSVNWLMMMSLWLLTIGATAIRAASSPDSTVCVGTITINHRTNISELVKYKNCVSLEGSIHINFALKKFDKAEDDVNFSFPNLREITDYLLLYRASQIRSLSNILPNLAVIRGHNLIQNYALAIYQMDNIEEVGLHSLTHILKGGVRIEKNPILCYVHSIQWETIVVDPIHKEHIIIEKNGDRCPDICPQNCDGNCDNKCDHCWDSEHCQLKLEKCPSGSGVAKDQHLCYTTPDGSVGEPCSEECLGGCTGPSPSDCFACKNMNWTGGHSCVDKCPDTFLSYLNWTCVTRDDCFRKDNLYDMDEDEESGEGYYKLYKDPTNNEEQCVLDCPANYQAENIGGSWECRPCSNCPRWCEGGIINTRESAERFRHCTHIRGYLEIHVRREGDITPVLEETLKDIKVITGYLKISRSYVLVSLNFFKSLRKIEGSKESGGDGSSISILENENLQKLFPDNSKVKITGKLFIHFNQKLCMDEIQSLIAGSNLDKPLEKEVSAITNGNKAFCSKEKLDFNILTAMDSRSVLLEIENYLQTLSDRSENTGALIGYEVNYREVSEEQFRSRNVSKFDGMDACGENTWSVLDLRPTEIKMRFVPCEAGTLGCQADLDKRGVYNPERTFLSKLKPYTPYAIYVTTSIVPNLVINANGAQSEIQYFRTATEPPEPVRQLSWRSESYSTLKVMWQPPARPHGIIDHYDIVLEYLNTNEGKRNTNINYCTSVYEANEEQASSSSSSKSSISDFVEPPLSGLNGNGNRTVGPGLTSADGNGVCPTCTCPADPGIGGGGRSMMNRNNDQTMANERIITEKHLSEQDFHNEILNKLFTVPKAQFDNADSGGFFQRRRRSVGGGAGRDDNDLDGDDKGSPELRKQLRYTVVRTSQTVGSFAEENVYNNTLFFNESDGEIYKGGVYKKGIYKEVYRRVSGNITEITFDRLKHFSSYSISVMACQAERNKFSNCSGDGCVKVKDCSSWATDWGKTEAKPEADNIVLINEKLEVFYANESTGETYLRWSPPTDPNGIIVGYKLRTTMNDDAQKTPEEKCIRLKDLVSLPDGNLEYRLERQGEYLLSLRAVSLYGGGTWTSWQWVKVRASSSYTWIIVLVVVMVIILAGMGVGAFIFLRVYKKNSNFAWDFSTTNTGYVTTDLVYQEDDWEVPRDQIKQGEKLGQGFFGICYRGVYHHPEKGDINVAVKTLPVSATITQRVEFLNEASVMKEINTTHVVKLLGVVSRGPTLVLMELMENGDLRHYLRSLRPDAENNKGARPPSLRHILQMAIEIADGMAYLSVKKFVHRDLAARNCMVSSDYTVKVGDFGMAQDVYEREYYRTEGRKMLPVRWMAPESLRDGEFTTRSDVWSYGVVLWEMATLAEQPYQGWSNDQVVTMVRDGNTMQRPENCPDILYELMTDCWQKNPDQRPSFLDLCERLLPYASELFRSNSFYCSSQGADAISKQSAARQAQEEADHLTPLTTNGGVSPDNGHVSDGYPPSTAMGDAVGYPGDTNTAWGEAHQLHPLNTGGHPTAPGYHHPPPAPGGVGGGTNRSVSFTPGIRGGGVRGSSITDNAGGGGGIQEDDREATVTFGPPSAVSTSALGGRTTPGIFSMNGLGFMHRIRNKSGSASGGEA